MPVPVTMRRFTNPSFAASKPAHTLDKEICHAERSEIGCLCFQVMVKERISHPERSAAQSKHLRLPSRNSLAKTRTPRVSLLRCAIALFLALIALQLPAQTTAQKPPPLTQDRDPVRSPDADTGKAPAGEIAKQGSGYIVHADVEEVSLNV